LLVTGVVALETNDPSHSATRNLATILLVAEVVALETNFGGESAVSGAVALQPPLIQNAPETSTLELER
jgi:hypothetical protein